MKYVRHFNLFKKDDIKSICRKYGIYNYTKNVDGSIDAVYILLNKMDLEEIPIKFNRVDDFNCAENKLTTLEGAPNYVSEHFNCNSNNLTTLKGAPSYVGGYFNCCNNKLTTLEGAPNYVDGYFDCDENNILTFEGAPNHLGGNFWCAENPIYWIWTLFWDYSKIELLNDYDALRIEDGRGICIRSRLNGFLEDIGYPNLTEDQEEEISKYYEIR